MLNAANAHQLIDQRVRLIALRKKSVRVPGELADRNGEIVSRDDLFDAVWPGKAISDDSLGQCVKDIRRAIGDADSMPFRPDRV